MPAARRLVPAWVAMALLLCGHAMLVSADGVSVQPEPVHKVLVLVEDGSVQTTMSQLFDHLKGKKGRGRWMLVCVRWGEYVDNVKFSKKKRKETQGISKETLLF